MQLGVSPGMWQGAGLHLKKFGVSGVTVDLTPFQTRRRLIDEGLYMLGDVGVGQNDAPWQTNRSQQVSLDLLGVHVT